MEYDALGKYPDYLRDFEDIKKLAEWQDMVFLGLENDIRSMMSRLKMSVSIKSHWPRFVHAPIEGAHWANVLHELHRSYPVVTFNELKNYILCWINPNLHNVEYDDANKILKIKTTVTKGTLRPYVNNIRNVIPCNMVLEIEYVEELG